MRPDHIRALQGNPFLLVLLSLVFGSLGCSSAHPTAPLDPDDGFSVSGVITERLSGTPVGGSTIIFRGPMTVSEQVAENGRYVVHGLTAGEYEVTIAGSGHVRHETQRLTLATTSERSFSVIRFGPSLFGATIDQSFIEYFHQLARVGPGLGTLRKWVVPPTELFLVEGRVPTEQFKAIAKELEHVNQRVVPALWCDWVGPLRINTGPLPSSEIDGRIVITPNWDDGASASLGQTEIRSGRIAINVFRPNDGRLNTAPEIRGILAHELFHVAGAFHTCGGDLGANPFGFSPSRCPHSDSLMANLGALVESPSREDRLASCLIYSRSTVPGNRHPDINPYYGG